MTLTERIAIANGKTISVKPTPRPEQAYTVVGAQWQESATNRIDYKGSAAHMIIGELVTGIHNGTLTVEQAEIRFNSALYAGRC
jgi:hypothetical protein